MPAEVNKCESCRFFHRREDARPEQAGQCRRFPPVRINNVTSEWPVVQPAYGCGEHVFTKSEFEKAVEATIHRVSQLPIVSAEPYEPSSHELLGSPDPYAVLPGEEDPKS